VAFCLQNGDVKDDDLFFLAKSDTQSFKIAWIVARAYAREIRTRLRVRQTAEADSHRHDRHDKTVLSASRPLRRCELDFRQLTQTVAGKKFEV